MSSGGYRVDPGTWNGGLSRNRCMTCGLLSVDNRVHPSAPYNAGALCGDCFRLLCRFDSKRETPQEEALVEQPEQALPTEDQLREWLNKREATRCMGILCEALAEIASNWLGLATRKWPASPPPTRGEAGSKLHRD